MGLFYLIRLNNYNSLFLKNNFNNRDNNEKCLILIDGMIK